MSLRAWLGGAAIGVACATAVACAGLLALTAGCSGGSDGACHQSGMPTALVTGAALFRVDLYAGTSCAALAGGGGPVASLSRTYAAGTPIVVDSAPGDYAVVVTSYGDVAGTQPLGSACSDVHFVAGGKLCLSLALDAVDLGGGADPSDLAGTGGGPLDLAAADLGYGMGAVLAQDDFHRNNQKGWGTASDGQPWGGSAAGTNTFGIVGGQGQVAAGGTATYAANLGPPVTDAEVLVTAAIMSSGAHWGAELRNGGSGTLYAAMLDGATLALHRVDGGTVTVLAQTNFGAATGTPYSVRFRVAGGTLSARVWAAGGAEPTAWTVTATDATPLGPGYGGLRFYVPGSTYVLVTSFLLMAL